MAQLTRKSLVTVAALMFVLFCLGGGVSVVCGLLYGFPSEITARFGVSSLFFVGFLITGVFGLGYALKNRLIASRCLLGLGVVCFSYFGIEVLFNAVGGR